MYASGMSPKRIADILNEESISSPGKYAYEKYGHKGRPNEMRLWCEISIRAMLDNIIYIGHLPMLQETSVSYKNHKRYKKDVSDWVITYNNHEPIISQELWDKVHERMKSVAQGRKTKTGFVHPLSGFLICADCGDKLKMSGTWNKSKGEYRYHFDCGYHLRYGKTLCFSHYIPAKVLEQIVLNDIQEKAWHIILDEQTAREEYIRHNAELTDSTIKTARKELKAKQRRLEELSRLMQVASGRILFAVTQSQSQQKGRNRGTCHNASPRTHHRDGTRPSGNGNPCQHSKTTGRICRTTTSSATDNRQIRLRNVGNSRVLP